MSLPLVPDKLYKNFKTTAHYGLKHKPIKSHFLFVFPATSDESTTTAAKIILSSSPAATLTTSNIRLTTIEPSRGILISRYIFSSSNMSTTAPTPTATQNHYNTITSTSLSPLSHRHHSRQKDIHLSSAYDKRKSPHKVVDSSKTKRSIENEAPECEPFTTGDESIKTFYSPGHPGEYTKNISCVRVIEGNVLLNFLVKCLRLG